MGTLRNINTNYMTELTENQFDILIDKIKQGYFIQFRLNNNDTLEQLRFEYILTGNEKYKQVLEVFKEHNWNKECTNFYQLVPMSYKTGTQFDIIDVTHDGYKTNHIKTLQNIDITKLRKLLDKVKFDIEFYTELLKDKE